MNKKQLTIVAGGILALILARAQWPAVPNIGLAAIVCVCIASGLLFEAPEHTSEAPAADNTRTPARREIIALHRAASVALAAAYFMYVDPAQATATASAVMIIALFVSIALLALAHLKFHRLIRPA